MNSKPVPEPKASWHVEHAALEKLWSAIEQVFAGPVDCDRLRRLLSELAHQLAKHFWQEEKGGYFAEVLSLAPELRARIERLQNEHVRMLEVVEELSRKVDAPVGSDTWQQLAGEYRELAVLFQRHEQLEEEMLQQAYQLDMGTKD
ncbi:MAG: hypothetical protein KatS3mg110_3043 [Pirellulaceae bacterium]|nr:MAG: hypothetical protein KatS3mg110_3043 [Pirellulaceae bacterium]